MQAREYQNCFQKEVEALCTTTDIEKINITDKEAYFLLKNATNELAALFRKTIMVDVPSMAIYPVIIYKNTTMYESFHIIHKLRFIPLPIDPSTYLFPDECDCTRAIRGLADYKGEIIGGCEKCSIEINLSVVGGWSDTDLREITSRNLWCPEIEDLFEKIPEIPLLRIKKGEEIHLKCRAFKGVGEINAMWSPVTIVSFEKMDSDEDDEDITYREDKTYRFYFEAVGSLHPDVILRKADEIYQKKKEELSLCKRDFRMRYLPTEENWKDFF